ncbi:hypothetical protein D9M69_680490 [compost metagenome]
MHRKLSGFLVDDKIAFVFRIGKLRAVFFYQYKVAYDIGEAFKDKGLAVGIGIGVSERQGISGNAVVEEQFYVARRSVGRSRAVIVAAARVDK